MLEYVLIDDCRDINKLVYADVDQTLTIRTFQKGLDFVMYTNLSELTLLMDNDLNDTRPKCEGYYILEAAIDSGNFPARVCIVSSNPVAVEKMSRLLRYAGYSQNGPIFDRD